MRKLEKLALRYTTDYYSMCKYRFNINLEYIKKWMQLI